MKVYTLSTMQIFVCGLWDNMQGQIYVSQVSYNLVDFDKGQSRYHIRGHFKAV